MITIKTFFRGFCWLNVILSPLHGLVIFLVLAYSDVGTLTGTLALLAWIIVFLLGNQGVSLLLMISIAKILDKLMYQNPFFSQKITQKASIISSIVSAFMMTVFLNIYADNLYQFKQGNYFIVLMPLGVILFYYFVCRILGGSHK